MFDRVSSHVAPETDGFRTKSLFHVRATMPTAKIAKPPAITERRSARASKAPSRYRPSTADMPEDFQEMIHDVACSAVGKSDVTFDPAAVIALEEALEPMLEALCKAALAHAEKDGRDTFTEADLKAVSKTYYKK